ncbi:MAG: metallophosphoesterase [Clostridia bacterium]
MSEQRQIRILVVGDVEAKYLWDYYQPGRLDGIGLILAAGDLDPHYLSFLATFSKGPVLYIHGNHDDRYAETPPEGCICIEDQLYVHQGLRIVGLGGCLRYNQGINQYSEREMMRRIRRLQLPLLRYGGCDILLTHAPARGLHDGSDPTHCGFQCFVSFLDRYQPMCFVHSHIHPSYLDGYARIDTYHGVQIINAYEKYIFELPVPTDRQKGGNRNGRA